MSLFSEIINTTITSSTTVSTTTTDNPDDNDPSEVPTQLVILVVCIAIPNLGGILAAVATMKNIDWYTHLNKPSWAPPSWLFGPVWTILYTLMGFASYLVYRAGGGLIEVAVPELVYASNLCLNLAWSPIFFGLQKIKLALAEIILIDVTALASAYLFYNVLSVSGVLMVPYLLWLVIATALNYSIDVLNPDAKKIYPAV